MRPSTPVGRYDGLAAPLPDRPAPLRYDAEGRAVFADWDENVPQDDLTQLNVGDEASASELEAFLAQVRLSDESAPPVSNGTPVASVTKAKPKKTPATRRPRKPKSSGQLEDISDEQLLANAGIVPIYSTAEAAQFFDKTTQWIYWGLGKGDDGPIFVHPDGTPINPERIGDPATGRRRFTLPIIKDILLSSYRRGNVEPEELKKILRRIHINELGGEWREREGWHKIRGKWVHPDDCTQIDGKWVKKKGV